MISIDQPNGSGAGKLIFRRSITSVSDAKLKGYTNRRELFITRSISMRRTGRILQSHTASITSRLYARTAITKNIIKADMTDMK